MDFNMVLMFGVLACFALNLMNGGYQMTRRKLLERAISIVCEDRNQQYGGPENTFKDIAALWAAYLGEQIGPEDVAIMMILMKVARLKASSYQSGDSWTDIAGYAACGAEIAITDDEEGIQC